MKIVILDGTHNKNGMTLKLVDKFLTGIRSVHSAAEVKTFDLMNSNINFCLGCNKCTEDKNPINAECSIKDDMQSIKEATLNCDVVVFASPIYEYAVSSVMKRFLERCLTLVTFKMGPVARAKAIKGKYGIVITSSGAPFPFNYLMGINRYPKFILKLACKLFRCSEIRFITSGGMMISEGFKNKWEKKAENLGIKVGQVFN